MFGIAVAFFTARLIIRWRLNGNLKLDDWLVAFAVFMLALKSILMTAYTSNTFMIQSVQIDHHRKPPDFRKKQLLYAHYQWAIAYFFFTGVWAIKASFLAFYNPLTRRLPLMRRAWYAATGFTALTYVGVLVASGLLNGNHFSASLKNKGINVHFACDLSTDVVSM